MLDPASLELAPTAPVLLERLDGDRRFKLELPASQLELTLGPFACAGELVQALGAARAQAAHAGAGLARLAAAGLHPTSPAAGPLNPGPVYEATVEAYGSVAARQLVCALQVHVAVGGAERTLAVYNALRGYLPLLSALAANAPFYEGRDCGLASARPLVAGLLPRQGVPPALASWEEYAAALEWGARAGRFAPRSWWWELRPHPGFGTLELRVADAQSTVAAAAGVALVVQALVHWLAARHDGGERTAPAPSWRIAENRWAALRDGVHATLADLETGEPRPAGEWLHELLDTLEPVAARLAPGPVIETARALVRRNGADAVREAAGAGGAPAAAAWLCECFLDGVAG